MALEDNTEQIMRAVDTTVHAIMAKTGEEFINNARTSVTQSIYDRKPREAWELTGNLRSSIGYHLVTKQGQQNDFVKGNDRGGAGKQAGHRVARDVTKGGSDFSLALVAGMPYTRYVEAKGYDVVSNSINTARQQFSKRLRTRLSKLK